MSEHPAPVLLVEDDLAVRSSLKFALELEGLAVRAYASGDELLSDPDLRHGGCLVVDFHLPGMSGIELIGKLEERHLHYPVIIITTGTAHGVLGVAAHPDIRGVLEKPLQDDALLVCIHAALAASPAPGRDGRIPPNPPRS